MYVEYDQGGFSQVAIINLAYISCENDNAILHGVFKGPLSFIYFLLF